MKFLHKRILKNFILILKLFKKNPKYSICEREVPTVKVNKIRMRETVDFLRFLSTSIILLCHLCIGSYDYGIHYKFL